MSVRWLHPNPDGFSWTVVTYVEEIAPHLDPNAHEKYQTWFIFNLQPDGICMNCRKRPGLKDPTGGYYSCAECRQRAAQAIAQFIGE